MNEVLEKRGESLLKSGTSLAEILRRPEVNYQDIEYIAELIEDIELSNYPQRYKVPS